MVCEACKGAREYWLGDRKVPCEWCGGRGVHGFHIARTAVCPNHAAPLDVFWHFYSGTGRSGLIVANRGGGKTRMDALLEHMLVRGKRYSVAHMGGTGSQAAKCRAHVSLQTAGDPEAPFVFDAQTKEPVPPGTPGAVPELVQDIPTLARWANGGRIDFLPGTVAQASGPHPDMSVLDEVDETKPDVERKFSLTPFGPHSIYLLTSTHTYETGVVARIKREQPHIPVFTWCIFESMRKCEYDCDGAPLPDGTKGWCPLFEEEVLHADGTRERRPVCGGKLARGSDGFIPLSHAITMWLQTSPHMRAVELLCREPSAAMLGGRAFWAYAPETRLEFDPVARPDAPLEWSMDFNPGIQSEMCSLVIQQAPPEYPNEWWVLDEIILPASYTAATIDEFLRRYGQGGHMAPAGVPPGPWVFGDATGHTRKSPTGETDYEIVVGKMRNLPGFRLCIPYGDANPPMVDRLNRTNEVLWHPVSGRRTLRVAPRCERLLDELSRLPLKPGTREKDKSPRLQKMGLTHLSDCLEYWAWARFPNGVMIGAAAVPMLGAARRDTAGMIAVGGRRASADAPSAGMPPPWAGSLGRDPREDW